MKHQTESLIDKVLWNGKEGLPEIIGILGFRPPGGWAGQSWSTLTFVAWRSVSVRLTGDSALCL